MKGDRDIVDEIDALVDEQLARYDQRSGYDHNVNQDRCPNCGRHWHGLPLTAVVAFMYATGRYFPEYSAADDHSPIVCPGSTAATTTDVTAITPNTFQFRALAPAESDASFLDRRWPERRMYTADYGRIHLDVQVVPIGLGLGVWNPRPAPGQFHIPLVTRQRPKRCWQTRRFQIAWIAGWLPYWSTIWMQPTWLLFITAPTAALVGYLVYRAIRNRGA
ncbi:hypothetical protein [Mycolicibacterium canariasense]|uniref:hypothetical protein n=1 Tax=Mycolicibacterium canariasense TaxID=228230 RepID=UPI000A167666|nr:hypothetical protein [Mycolicibacterium canariasense]MCV7208381.1 hypothetical protein [Mycolicibacterium canariasense]ORV13564.1 hypothetical protein AWB94_04905 [Mycolicibacterium canariasense]